MRSAMPKLLILLLALLFVDDAAAQRWSAAQYAGVFTDPELDEVSGLAASHVHAGVFWAHNDGGDPQKLMAIRADGTRMASFKVAGAGHVDWEDIDSFTLDGRPYLLVADTG